MSMAKAIYIVNDRVVMTYEPEVWPEGVLTGYYTNDNGFMVEHIITFNSHALLGLIRGCMDEATMMNLDYITFYIPRDIPNYRRLNKLARYFSFNLVEQDETSDIYVRMAPFGF